LEEEANAPAPDQEDQSHRIAICVPTSCCDGRGSPIRILRFFGDFNCGERTSNQVPQLLTYDELVRLYEQQTPAEAIAKEVECLIDDTIRQQCRVGARCEAPLNRSSAKLGKFVRVVEWNIERGLEYDAIRKAFTNPAAFAKLIDSSA